MLPTDELSQWALAQIGNKWPSGALFVQAAYKSVGIKIPASGLGQAYRAGKRVTTAATGDIVMPRPRVCQLCISRDVVIGVTKQGVVKARMPKYPWRVIRITTPGGPDGLTLARPS